MVIATTFKRKSQTIKRLFDISVKEKCIVIIRRRPSSLSDQISRRKAEMIPILATNSSSQAEHVSLSVDVERTRPQPGWASLPS